VLAWAVWLPVWSGWPCGSGSTVSSARPAGPAIDRIGAADSPYVLAAVSAATVGAVLGQPPARHPVGRLLPAVIDQTMQPTQATLWLRPQTPSRSAGPSSP
jgi:hypothetical protein